ncbi:hypothetical protein GCM10020221_18150 [Streptomyces thioluteus]|uniref:Uncharacterized protein n=2 Tax=Streptomyces thioluteus TaxID=66431 RepID=A0ABP6J8D2_STRTU
MLLTLGLLEAYDAEDPVPVLMTASSWHPRREHPYTWLARRLVQAAPLPGRPAGVRPRHGDPAGDRGDMCC